VSYGLSVDCVEVSALQGLAPDLFLWLGTVIAEMSFATAVEAGGILDAINVHWCAVSLGHGFLFGGGRRDAIF
jgi:hypothetical protein